MLFLANPPALNTLCAEEKFSSKAASLVFRGSVGFKRVALLRVGGRVKQLKREGL